VATMGDKVLWVGEQEMSQGVQRIGRRNGLELAVPSCERKGIGDVIVSPDSSFLIAGVRIEPVRMYKVRHRREILARNDS
jgi:hypothetical protein